VGRVFADRHGFAVVPVAMNSFAALTGRRHEKDKHHWSIDGRGNGMRNSYLA
jgi:hypothetical protein